MSEPLRFEPAELIASFGLADAAAQYYRHLMVENARVNLVSRTTDYPQFERLYAESLLPLRITAVLPDSRYLDIGSGGGFPAVPLLQGIPEIVSATLIERRQKKAAALSRVFDQLELTGRFFSKSFEEISLPGPFELITLRWVNLTADLLDRILKRLSPQGLFIYYSAPDFPVTDLQPVITTYVLPGSEQPRSISCWHQR